MVHPVSRAALALQVALFVVLATPACKKSESASEAASDLVLATTTSTYDSGLLDVLIPPFEAREHVRVKILAVGTGEALSLGRRGVADVVLVHAPAAEEKFVQEGHGIDRRPVMWNDFVIVGDAADPAHVKGNDAAGALQKIAEAGAPFVSRGDDSGTHKKERALWASGGGKPDWPGYLEAGQGMAMTLRIAHEKRAYVLTDRGTYLAASPSLKLEVIVEGDVALANPYHVIRVNPQMHPDVHVELGKKLADYLTAADTAVLINGFGVEKFGRPLFHAGTLDAS